MAKKLTKNSVIKYICEKCNEVMFKVFKDTNDDRPREPKDIYKIPECQRPQRPLLYLPILWDNPQRVL